MIPLAIHFVFSPWIPYNILRIFQAPLHVQLVKHHSERPRLTEAIYLQTDLLPFSACKTTKPWTEQIKRSHSNITTYHKCFSYLKRALATRDSHHQYQYNINRQANPSEESSCRRNQHAPWPHHSNNTKHTHTTWKLETNEKITRMMKPCVNPKCARTRTKRTKITPPTNSKPYAFCLDLAKRGS